MVTVDDLFQMANEGFVAYCAQLQSYFPREIRVEAKSASALHS
jgi:hypothetical protein